MKHDNSHTTKSPVPPKRSKDSKDTCRKTIRFVSKMVVKKLTKGKEVTHDDSHTDNMSMSCTISGCQRIPK